MGGLLLGFALGAMAFTEKGREIGNQIGTSAMEAAKKVMKCAEQNQSAERTSGTPGDNRSGR